jgi:hypothetical protein
VTNATAAATAEPRRLGRSIAALLAGFIAVVVLSLGTDEVLHIVRVYPPWGEPMYDTGLNLLALTYRAVFTIVGGYLTAWLAPYSPMRHVQIGAGIGLVLGTLGVVGALSVGGLGPLWYPIGVAVTGPLCNLLGGALYVRGGESRLWAGVRW